ncbi:hypothetical protein D3C78_1681510 [compost metagenome]
MKLPLEEKYTLINSIENIKMTPKKTLKRRLAIESLFLIFVVGSGISASIDGFQDFVTVSMPSFFFEFRPVCSIIAKTIVTHTKPCTNASIIVVM